VWLDAKNKNKIKQLLNLEVIHMPLVEISVVPEALSEGQKVEMANEICAILMKAIPRLPKEAISVIFYENLPENWIVGGIALKEIMGKRKGRR